MINFARIRELIFESYEARLISRGVSQEIIEYIASLNSSDRGGVISKVMSNPKLSLDDVRLKEKFRVKNNAQHKMITDADPTPDKSYYEILAKWFTVDKTLSLPNDTERTTEALDYYNKNKRRFATAYITKYKTFQALEQEYLTVSGKKSKRQEIKDIKVEGSTKMYENSTWAVYAVTTHAAACFYGSGTTWCTASNKSSSAAESYLRKGPLKIFVNKKTSEKYQATTNYDEFRDAEDQSVRESDYNSLSDHQFKELLHIAYKAEIEMKDRKHAYPEEVIELMLENRIKLPDDALETIIKTGLKDPKKNARLMSSMVRMDPSIASGPHKKSIEFIISHRFGYAYEYWGSILNASSKFPDLEKTIFRDVITDISGSTDGTLLKVVHYAEKIYPGGWKQFEESMLKKFDDLQKGRMGYSPKFHSLVFTYCIHVRKSRWKEAEPYLQRHPPTWNSYYKKFKNEMKDYGLNKMLNMQSWENMSIYAIEVEKKRIPEFEKLVLNTISGYEFDRDSHAESHKDAMKSLSEYIRHFNIKGELPNALIDQLITNLASAVKKRDFRWRMIEEILEEIELLDNNLTEAHAKAIPNTFLNTAHSRSLQSSKIFYSVMKKYRGRGVRWKEFEQQHADFLSGSKFANASDTYEMILKYMEVLIIKHQRINPVLEEQMIRVPYFAAEYAVKYLDSYHPVEAVHNKIVTDPNPGRFMGSSLLDYISKYRNIVWKSKG